MNKEDEARSSKTAARQKRRRSRRFNMDLAVHLFWQDDAGSLYDAPAALKSVSLGGFGVEVDTGLALGRFVTVKTPQGSSLPCVVRDLRSGPNGTVVGLEALPTSDYAESLRALQTLSEALDRTRDDG